MSAEYDTLTVILTLSCSLGPPLSLIIFEFAITEFGIVISISSRVIIRVLLIPILLTKRKPPTFKKTTRIKIKELYKISPLATFSMFCVGFIHPAIFTMGAVYGALMNFSVFEISLYLFLITLSLVMLFPKIFIFSTKSFSASFSVINRSSDTEYRPSYSAS